MKTINLISTTILFLMLCFSVQGQDWNGNDVTSSNGRAAIGIGLGSNTTSKLRINNDSEKYGLFVKTTEKQGRYGILNKVYNDIPTTATTIPNNIFGIRTDVVSSSPGIQYGIYTRVINSGTDGGITANSAAIKYGIYSEVEANLHGNNRAGYFKGSVEIKGGDFMIGGDAGGLNKFRMTNDILSGVNVVALMPRSDGNINWNWNRSMILDQKGTLTKRIDGGDKTAFQVVLNGGANPRFKILGDGRTVIGVADDNTELDIPNGYKLYVKDGILTEQVKVALHDNPNNWADYVFDEDYKLMSLQQLKTYITENQHLPNIPSAQDLIDDGGVELMEMTKLQMEKIEELTLYMIQMNERMEKLEKENEDLKNKLKRRKK